MNQCAVSQVSNAHGLLSLLSRLQRDGSPRIVDDLNLPCVSLSICGVYSHHSQVLNRPNTVNNILPSETN